MKKIFTLIAVALLGGGNLFAQDGVIELSWASMVKDDAGTNAKDQNNIEFYLADGTTKSGFVLQPAGGRSQAGPMDREDCTGRALNFKNNTNQILTVPGGTKVYKINFYGWSQGDNWTYLYAFGPSTDWFWKDGIGEGVTDVNTKIIDGATYPIDPCVVNEANVKDTETTCFHKAGYCFASIDIAALPGGEPLEGQFCFVFNGNNQERAWMVVYTTKEAAKAAPVAETPRLGKDKSNPTAGIIYQSTPTGISAINANDGIENAAIYNIAGQKVDASYKGLVIKNGKKYIVK